MPNMNIKHLRSFVAMVEEKSSAKAARRLGLPRQSVTQHVAAVERAVGRRLLETAWPREPRQVGRTQLTDCGLAFFPKAARAVRAEEAIAAETLVVRFEEGSQGGLAARRLEAFGGVEVRSGVDMIKGERGFYDTVAQTAEICGDVRVQQGPNRMAGECAELDLARGRSRLVAGAGGRVSGLFEPGEAEVEPAR